MTPEQLIDGVLDREGGFTDSAADKGGATNYGITAAVLGEWRRLGRPASRLEIQKLTKDEAQAIYRAQYFRPFESIPFPEIQAQLVDIAVNSGQAAAITMLQEVLEVPVDGVLGDRTRRALAAMPWKLTNAALVAARVKRYVELVRADAGEKVFLLGWIDRACGFLV